MNSRSWLFTCIIICCLAMMAAGIASSAPYRIYEEQRAGGSIYYIGAVVGDTCYTGQIAKCAQQWGDVQIGGTALLNHGPDTGPANTAKCSLPLGGYVYMTNGGNFLRRQALWSEETVEVGGQTGMDWAPDAICTDGTYIYATQGSSGPGAANGTHVIYKFAIDHSGPAGTLSRLAMWSQGTSADHRFRAISYWNGKLYVVNHRKAGGQIYEVDPDTGAFTLLAATPTAADSHYQVARYGNQLFVVGLDCNIYTYTLSGATWSLTSTEPTGYVQSGAYGLFGIGVKGDGTTAKYAWITGPPAGGAPKMTFWDLSPTWPAATVGEVRGRMGYPVTMQGVVTKIGASAFWVEDKNRSAAVQVPWTGTMPSVDTEVSMKGGTANTASGEKVFNVFDGNVTSGSSFTLKPLALSNKTLGAATGSSGLANDGMLVKVWGKVTHYDEATQAMYIDDGSGVASDLPTVKGVKVLTADILSVPGYFGLLYPTLSPCFAEVIGVVRLDQLGDGTIVRRIDARTDADIVLTAL